MNSQPTLEFAASDEIAGFRLKRLELYNWGTFHNHVWSLNPEGRNILVTGDIGSGKSTLIDAITTLLVPPARITYNKATGADKSERTLRTYVLGYYKSERSDTGLSSKPVALRDNNSYSVILGVFENSGFSQTITLAQVFCCRETTGQPDRFYVVAPHDLTLKEHFANFGNELGSLKKRLKSSCKAAIHDSFAGYSGEFKRLFGIGSDQALELFNQTVSMK
ncbi:MAG: Chromosome segregation protein SMC-like [Candidatus Rifleibacterium amylolyticum]|nr:MAG: Chromosome segregation protein SMC-like [Candidatus Rifleibacterium amylolyticum]